MSEFDLWHGVTRAEVQGPLFTQFDFRCVIINNYRAIKWIPVTETFRLFSVQDEAENQITRLKHLAKPSWKIENAVSISISTQHVNIQMFAPTMLASVSARAAAVGLAGDNYWVHPRVVKYRHFGPKTLTQSVDITQPGNSSFSRTVNFTI